MITIRKHKNILTVNGHANSAPYGKDIVCAMVSILLWSFVESCQPDEIRYCIKEGAASITLIKSSPELAAKVDMLMTGLNNLARDYKDYVQAFMT